jgi:ribose transport system substrate-binding protein
VNRRRTLSSAVAATLLLAMAACGSDGGSSTPTAGSASGGTTAAAAAVGSNCDAAMLSKIQTSIDAAQSKAQSTGPNGETAKPASDVTLTDDEIATVKAMNATAAIVFHTKASDWSTAQEAGLKTEFERLGITVTDVTDAGFKADQQITDIETVMAKKPSVMVSIPVDAAATADAYKAVAAAGTKLVFMDNVAAGLKQGSDYVSVVSADNYGNGVVSAHLMAKALCGKGKIATVFHGADFFVTKQRHEGFVNTIKSDYPDIQIVDEKGIDGADFATLAQDATNAILAKNQDLQGIWAVWDTPAEGVLAAINSNNRQGVIVITEDLGKPVAIEMAKNGQVRGLGAQRPYQAGITEADLAAYGLLGKTAPDYVALPALAVDHDNVLQSWKDVYFQDAPADIAGAFKN